LTALNDMEETHKRLLPQRPHWYLWALGVDPKCQGQGTGSQLIEPVLVRSDAEKTPCYLEALTEKNMAFYQKRGFDVVHKSETSGWGAHVWAMLREPR
jgi:ribosomal protein S18 acetylase RimI-like enzyme